MQITRTPGPGDVASCLYNADALSETEHSSFLLLLQVCRAPTFPLRLWLRQQHCEIHEKNIKCCEAGVGETNTIYSVSSYCFFSAMTLLLTLSDAFPSSLALGENLSNILEAQNVSKGLVKHC